MQGFCQSGKVAGAGNITAGKAGNCRATVTCVIYLGLYCWFRYGISVDNTEGTAFGFEQRFEVSRISGEHELVSAHRNGTYTFCVHAG